ncbi:restriction endonuclease [Nocardia farcinica]|uniref:restriction endonuclease n=1 Tax=Nocardia farcinica TaxID=37329 RepID=UPI003CC7ED71
MKYIATPYEAEENAAVQMRSLGFSDARVTASGADGGIDVRASGADAQVKWRAGQVGRPELQRLFGARGKRFELQLFFFAASPYSTHAVSYANEVDMALYTYDPTGRITPVNPAAKRIAARVSAPVVDSPSRRSASEPRPRGSTAASRQREQAAQRKADLAEVRERWKDARSTKPAAHRTGKSEPTSSNRLRPV